VLDGFWENSFGNIIDYDQLVSFCFFPSWKISGRGGKGAGGEEAHNTPLISSVKRGVM